MGCTADDIACHLRSIAQSLADPLNGFWASALSTLIATVVGALIALGASWWLYTRERKHLRDDRAADRLEQRADQLDRHIEAIVALLAEYADATIFYRGEPSVQTKRASERKREQLVARIRVAMLYANDVDRLVLQALMTGVSGTKQLQVGSEAVQVSAWGLLIVDWRTGQRDAAAVADLLREAIQVVQGSALPANHHGADSK